MSELYIFVPSLNDRDSLVSSSTSYKSSSSYRIGTSPKDHTSSLSTPTSHRLVSCSPPSGRAAKPGKMRMLQLRSFRLVSRSPWFDSVPRLLQEWIQPKHILWRLCRLQGDRPYPGGRLGTRTPKIVANVESRCRSKKVLSRSTVSLKLTCIDHRGHRHAVRLHR